MCNYFCISGVSAFAVQLSILPYLVPPKGRCRIGAKHWKYSIVECVEAILIHVKVNIYVFSGYDKHDIKFRRK